MGTTTSRKRSKSTVVVGAQQDGAQPVAQEVAQRKARKARKPVACGTDGKPLHGLTATPDGYTPTGKVRLVRQQFASAQHWFAHCARMAEMEAKRYAELAADAAANPAKYKRAGAAQKVSALQAQCSALEKALLERGFTEEQIAAMVAGA